MDKSKSSSQPSSLDSLRTVEFRQTLRGYHIDDVDEYLERVAVDAEALQEQLRQAGDRVKQAADRIAQLERQAQQPQAPGVAAAAPPVADDSLQRTLVLAQKFVEQTQAEAEAEARRLLGDAEHRARAMVDDAEQKARAVTQDTERNLREEIGRLESLRTKLAADVETMARHLDTERTRLRDSLADMLAWVDEHVQPGASLLVKPPEPRREPEATPPESSAGQGQGSLLRPPSAAFGSRLQGQEPPAFPSTGTPVVTRTEDRSGPGPATGDFSGDRAGVRR